MSLVEWSVPFRLVSALGTLLINTEETIGTAGTFLYLLDKTKCRAAPQLRVNRDNIPQADGSILHTSFKTGYVMTLGIEFWKDRENVACDCDLRMMMDHLMAHVDALLNEDGRVYWQPSCYGDERMLINLRLADGGWPEPFYETSVTGVTMILNSPFPYALDSTELDTALPDSSTVSVFNDGTTPYWPVFQIDGAFSTFLLSNLTTGQQIEYDSSNPGGAAVGGGDYAEIITFRNTIYLNGNSSNLKPGIDPETTVFFPLVPGENQIILTGASGTLKSNNSWP